MLKNYKEKLRKSYNEESDEGYFLEVDVQYVQKLHELHNDLPFLPERMKIEKFEKLCLTNLHDHELVLKKVHRVIKFNENVWLKLYIDMNTDLRKEAKNDFEKYFSKFMNNAVFRKTIENMREPRNIVTTKTKKKIFGVRAKLSYWKVFHGKPIRWRNRETYE